MNREIEYRGRSLSDDRWVYGYYLVHEAPLAVMGPSDHKDIHYIVETGFADWGMERPLTLREVEPATVGQFTGLKDSKGRRIYERDIVRPSWSETAQPGWVEFQAPAFVIRHNTKSGATSKGWSTFDLAPDENQVYEVIGTVHQNPKLLEANA